MSPWLFLHEPPCPPPLAMERDLALFHAVRSGSLPGTLRVYTWAGPALTTGHHQKTFPFHDRDLVLPVLRRPTGGGAVLHVDDVTFSICAPAGGPLPTAIPQCAEVISRVFASALRRCGVQADLQGGGHAFSPVCFARPSPVELTSGGRKVMGLAVARKGRSLLAQGVIPLRTDPELAARVFGPEGMPACQGILEQYPAFSPGAFIACLQESLASLLGVTWDERPC